MYSVVPHNTFEMHSFFHLCSCIFQKNFLRSSPDFPEYDRHLSPDRPYRFWYQKENRLHPVNVHSPLPVSADFLSLPADGLYDTASFRYSSAPSSSAFNSSCILSLEVSTRNRKAAFLSYFFTKCKSTDSRKSQIQH